jgi:hypothetical protein
MRRFVDRGGRDRRVDLLELTRRPRTHREKQFDGLKSFVRACETLRLNDDSFLLARDTVRELQVRAAPTVD